MKCHIIIVLITSAILTAPFYETAGRCGTMKSAQLRDHCISPEKSVEYRPGTLPLILSVPHDGACMVCGLPPRTNAGKLRNFITRCDRFTADIAEETAAAIKRITGRKPHMVINHLHRKYMDPNRRPGQAWEHPLACKVHMLYHKTITRAVKNILAGNKAALILDIHGQTKNPADIYLGTRNGKTITYISARMGPAVLYGHSGLGKLLALKGYAVAGISDTITTDWIGEKRLSSASIINLPRKIPRGVTGGYIVGYHGQSKETTVDAIQIEIHRRIRYDPMKRKIFAIDLAETVSEFLRVYYLPPR